MKLAELTWPEIEKLDREIVVVSPIGALEQHSRHLPFFTDTIICDDIANRLEAALPSDILLLPTQWLGASAHHLGMAGTLTAENETFIKLLCEPLRCLLRQGFVRIFIINGHGGNIDGFHLALRQLAFEFPAAMVGGASYWDFAKDEIAVLLDGKRKAIGHACEFETSVMMYLRPDLVRVDEIADDELKPAAEVLRNVYLPLDMKRQTDHGGTGSPTLADGKKGQALANVIVANGIKIIKAVRSHPIN